MSYSAEVLADSPLAYWRLDETSGTSAADSSGNSRTATYVASPTLGVTGLLGGGDTNRAMGVTANSGSCANIASASWMNVSTITVECIANLTSATDVSNGDGIVSRWAGGGFDWLIWRTTAGLWGCQLSNGAGATKTIAGSVSVVTSTTYHLAMTYDGSTMILYVNGVATDSLGSMGGGIFAGGTPVSIGRHSIADATVPGGTIDEVAIYGSALSAGRIAAHYAAGFPSPDATVLVPVATATADALVPVVTADSLVVSPVATASADALVPTVSTANDATVLVPTAAATATALVPVPTFDASTDTSNVFTGRSRSGSATVELVIPVDPTPTGTTRATRVDKAVPLPMPTLVNGRPT